MHKIHVQIFRFFRVIPAEQYLAEFSSDRRHMKRTDGTWIKQPPPYPPIQSSGKWKMQIVGKYFQPKLTLLMKTENEIKKKQRKTKHNTYSGKSVSSSNSKSRMEIENEWKDIVMKKDCSVLSRSL